MGVLQQPDELTEIRAERLLGETRIRSERGLGLRNGGHRRRSGSRGRRDRAVSGTTRAQQGDEGPATEGEGRRGGHAGCIQQAAASDTKRGVKTDVDEEHEARQ